MHAGGGAAHKLVQPAERLEHAISDAVLDRLDALLGHPPVDPHGDPIPSRQGQLPSQVYATLATCGLARALRVVRVTDQSVEFLQFAEQHGLLPGAALRPTDPAFLHYRSGAFYLARAGLRTLVLERREIVGGACLT